VIFERVGFVIEDFCVTDVCCSFILGKLLGEVGGELFVFVLGNEGFDGEGSGGTFFVFADVVVARFCSRYGNEPFLNNSL